MACGTGIVKFILFVFNFLIVVGGVLFITGGALSLSGFDKYKEYVDLSDWSAAPITSIVFGTIVFLIAFMGCCGVLRENNCMMITYAVTLGIILIAEIGIVVVSQIYQEEFKDLVSKGFTESRAEYSYNDEVTKNWDSLQHRLYCCGINSYDDWASTKFGKVPDSCCIENTPGCATGMALVPEIVAEKMIFTKGCVNKVIEELPLEHVLWAGGIIVAVELLGIIFGCCLAARFRHEKTYHRR